MSVLGERLAQVRKQARLSQAQLGAALVPPVSALSVRNWEKGVHSPRADHLLELARVLHSTVGYLTGETNENTPQPPPPPAIPRTYDPDEPPVPRGLQQLIDMGVPMRRDEFVRLLGYADALNTSRGARGAASWTCGQWLDVLHDERRRAAEGEG